MQSSREGRGRAGGNAEPAAAQFGASPLWGCGSGCFCCLIECRSASTGQRWGAGGGGEREVPRCLTASVSVDLRIPPGAGRPPRTTGRGTGGRGVGEAVAITRPPFTLFHCSPHMNPIYVLHYLCPSLPSQSGCASHSIPPLPLRLRWTGWRTPPAA